MNPNRKSTPSGVLPPSPTAGGNPDGTPGGDSDSEIEMSLRLVCSMSGNRSKAFWEDVTDTTPMTVVLKNSNSVSGVGGALENKYNLSQANIVQDSSTAVDLRNPDSSPGRTPYAGNVLNSIEIEDNSRSPGSVQFTSLVSAAFWLVYCPNWMSSDVISLVDQIYKVSTYYITNSLFLERILEFFHAHSPSQSAPAILKNRAPCFLKIGHPAFCKKQAEKNQGHFLFKKRRDQAASSLLE